ncbi:unnamed protein product [Candidula unifasciata]|uniref:G-protein coupled receptors family 1 profile domain-containing protein n=1 Tax=Candidula unifasciata TaxID=100452 RepID=A0A8S3ZCH2_9EUPU|nr:unnamed protein product [Candidula unifasciata]
MQTLSPATFFIVMLAFFDGSTLIVRLIYHQLYKFQIPILEIGCKMELIVPYLVTLANWMLVLICIERFISVCYPLKKLSLVTKTRSYVCVGVLSVFFLVLYSVIFGITTTTHENKCGIIFEYDHFIRNYWYFLNAAIVFFIPFLIILVLTAGVARGLYRSRITRRVLMQSVSARESGNTSVNINNERLVAETERAEMAITIIVITAAVLFLMLTIPTCFYYFLSPSDYHGDCLSQSGAYWALFNQLQHLLMDATHVLNFFLYFLAAKRFRDQVFKLCRCQKREQETQPQTISSKLSSSSKTLTSVSEPTSK